jgi:Cu+-exporting ATPase
MDHKRHSKPDVTYICPMHPEVRQDNPGNCPKCGMTLVPEGEIGAQHAHSTAQGHSAPLAEAASSYDRVPAGWSGPVYTCPMHPQVRQTEWAAPTEWSGLNVSAWSALGPSGRGLPALAGGIPRRCAA